MSWMKTRNSKYSWARAYNEIKNKHDDAFRAIDRAISLEEQEKPHEAILMYKDGIRLIDEALAVQVQCPEKPDDTWQKACSMIQKIKKTRAEVMLRISCIQKSPSFVPDIPQEDPPSYDEAVSSSEEEVPRTYKDLATALQELSVDPNQRMHEEIIYTHDNVRLYFISPTGEVLSTREPQTLTISSVESNTANASTAVLQIGDFVYPLVPAVSPCYRTDYGAFILPDLNATLSGSSIGIILPSDADDEVFDLLESILHGIISQVSSQEIEEWRKRREAERPEDYSTRVSNRILDSAYYISQCLVSGAMKTGDFFNNTTPKIIDSMNGAEEPKDVPRTLTKSMKIAEKTTNKAAHVTGFVAEKVGNATVRLGQFLAPHIQKQGTKLLTNFNMSEQEASDKMKNILTITAGAVEGFSTVYAGLETSAGILGKSLKDNTVKIVHHKYGQPASNLTDDTLSTVGNVYHIAHNSKIFTPKGLVKRTAKDTSKAVIQDYSSSKRARESYNRMITETEEEASGSAIVTEDNEDNGKVAKKG